MAYETVFTTEKLNYVTTSIYSGHNSPLVYISFKKCIDTKNQLFFNCVKKHYFEICYIRSQNKIVALWNMFD